MDGASLTPLVKLLLALYRSRAAQHTSAPPSASFNDMPDPSLFDTHELVSTGRVGPRGVRLTLRVRTGGAAGAADLDRTVMRSDAASLSIPALGVSQPDGTGRMASVRDVLDEVRRGVEQGLAFAGQTGSAQGRRVLTALENYAKGREGCTLVLDDPLGVSRISPPPTDGADAKGASSSADPALEVVEYERSWDQTEEHGLHMAYTVPAAVQAAQSSVEALAALLARSKRVVVFTGAGISTESDIPAFWVDDADRQLRSVWNSYPHDQFTEPKLTADSAIRTQYWQMDRALFGTMSRAQPNAAHKFLGYLHARGQLHAVITQNIDGLHARGGVPTPCIRQLHGCNATVTCRRCRAVVDHRVVLERLNSGEADPACLAPAASAVAVAVVDAKSSAAASVTTATQPGGVCGGVLLPDVVHFGAPLDPVLLAQAQRDVQHDADLFVGIGSSFFVAPANTLPGDAILRRIPFVLLNKSHTKFDAFAAIRLTAPCGQVLAAVQAIMERDFPVPLAKAATAASAAAAV